ncbi:hypothetical protein AVEN_267039-1 [Araneus ventricosus]|uniref:Uncharacterized protein n=1 Tax=Araneus ventricosus TaxID=182803 RepID=A0A4Y2R114_ARAVE|nr:hypothetical protein AVEN_267039-1 [Araneus ventricosus]
MFHTGQPSITLNRPISFTTHRRKVKFHLFTPSNLMSHTSSEVTLNSVEEFHTFDARLETKFMIHGFMSDLDFDDVRFGVPDNLICLSIIQFINYSLKTKQIYET